MGLRKELRPTKVAIDVRATTKGSGGVGQAIRSLIYGLGKLDDGPETYTLIVRSEEQLESHKLLSGPNQHFVIWPDPPSRPKDRWHFLKRPLKPLARRLRAVVNPHPRTWPEVAISNGSYERLGCDVLHLPTQRFTICAMPTIYNPHDLQHLHYPQLSTPHTLAYRETVYHAGCHFANTVVVGSQWVKDDVIRHYRVNPEKVQVIPEAPATEFFPEPTEEDLAGVRAKYQIEQPFTLYPAVTWPHKNHLRLIEALAYLRDNRGLSIPLVCTGSRFKRGWPEIESRINELNLSSQVKFLGFLPYDELRAVFRLAQFLVEPSLFEASSLPIFEAWFEGLPVACSDASALPDQVMNAALLFDPTDVISIANAIARMATEAELRDQLRSRGYRRLQDFDWERTAKAYRAVYRRAAGQLTDEDRWLLSWDWMRNPEKKMEVA